MRVAWWAAAGGARAQRLSGHLYGAVGVLTFYHQLRSGARAGKTRTGLPGGGQLHSAAGPPFP